MCDYGFQCLATLNAKAVPAHCNITANTIKEEQILAAPPFLQPFITTRSPSHAPLSPSVPFNPEMTAPEQLQHMIKVKIKLQDFGLLSWHSKDFHSFGLLHSAGWFFTVTSMQGIGPIFMGEDIQDILVMLTLADGPTLCPEMSIPNQPCRAIAQGSETLKSKFVSVHVMKKYTESKGMTLLILRLGIR